MNKARHTNIKIITCAIFLTTFMTAIEGTIVSTAMPTIVSDLNGLEIMSWVVSIFLLMTAVTTPIYGKLADSFGRKPVFLFGILIFVIGSSLCGLAQNMFQLIIFRTIQGLGSGAIQPVAITMLADLYPIDKRSKILGLNCGFWGVAAILAPLLGGFIVQHLSWHWIFYINVPIGIAALIMVQVYFIEKKVNKIVSLDYAGSAILIVFLLSLMLFLQFLDQPGTLLLTIALLIISIFSFVLFFSVEKKAKDPIIPLSIIKNKEFICHSLITLLISGVVIGFEFYIPTWMQGINGVSSSMAGFAVTPSSLLWIVGSFISGTLMFRYGTKKLFDVFLAVLLLADICLLFVPIYTPLWVFCVLAAVNGIGFGIIITVALMKSQLIVSPKDIGVATAFNTLLKFLGQTMMVSLFGVVFNTSIMTGLQKHPQLTQNMMNKIVASAKLSQLDPKFVPQLRMVLINALKSGYWVALVLIVVSFLLNHLYKEKRIKK
ncbi:MDR family MFS transporter [Lactobacillus iners]|uniref:MDR family MFS transporter n=1 Tax=Lactobacillus iners TaxID=147802 RepID=UPI0001FD7533|nr:MDR family MFS transporter [Lactobacillus iners]EGC80467.1 transporter, major facilitator family protein [Lactobacillus iners UPII 60-B]